VKKIKKEVNIKLEFFEGKQDVKNQVYKGNVKEPEALDELI
jgi:hypothetical protein